MTDTWVIPVSPLPLTTNIPSFFIEAHTGLWTVAFFLLANQGIYANEASNMHIWRPQTWWVILVPTTTHIPSFITVVHTKLWMFTFLISQ